MRPFLGRLPSLWLPVPPPFTQVELGLRWAPAWSSATCRLGPEQGPEDVCENGPSWCWSG